VPLGFRAAHHISVADASGLLLALAQLGLPAGKPVSAYVHRLFKQRLAELAKPRKSKANPAILAVAAAILLSAVGWAFLGGRFQDSAVDSQQRFQILTTQGSEGAKSFISFHFYPTSTTGRRSAERQVVRISNIDVFQFDRSFRQTSRSSNKRAFILPSDGYEYKYEMDSTLRTTLEEKGTIAICVEHSLDNGKTIEKIGKIFAIEEAQKYGDTYYSIKFDAPDDALVEAITKATACRYVL
jgi:hypothetical protein